MFTVTTLHRNSADIVHWLQENIGPVLHYQPIIFWHGQGWHMRNYHRTDLKNPENNRHGWSIEFEDSVDERKILLFKIQFG